MVCAVSVCVFIVIGFVPLEALLGPPVGPEWAHTETAETTETVIM